MPLSKRASGYSALILFSVVVASWFVQTVFPIQSFDFYYHLATGRWIVDNASIPVHDVFSSTASGTRWVTHEWAVQVVMYLFFLVIGLNGLIVLKAIWLAAVAALLCLLGSSLKSPAWWTALLVALAAPCIAFRAFLRPHVVSHGFMAVLITLLYTGVPQRTRSRMMVFGLLFLVWSNCHSGFVFGLFILVIHEAGAVLAGRAAGRKKLPESLAVAGVAAVSALINPNTWRSFAYPFAFIRHSELFGLVAELRPVTTPAFQGGWFIPIFMSLMLSAAVLCLLRIRHGSSRELILLVVFGYLAMKSVRNIPNAALVVLPGLFVHGGAVLRRISGQSGWRYLTVPAMAAVLVIPVFLIRTACTHGIPTDRVHRRSAGLGVHELNYPKGAVDYLGQNSVHGHYFNTFAFGGYLLWAMYPEPSVFIDGRLFVFHGPVLKAYLGVLSGGMSLDELHDRHGVTHLVLAYPETPGEAESGLYALLTGDTGWRTVYWDDNSMVFVKENHQNAALIQSDGYRVIHPLFRTIEQIDKMVMANPDPVFREAERAHLLYPRNTGAAVILGRYHHIYKHDYDKAAEFYDKVLRKHPQNRQIRIQKALALMAFGVFGDAETEWRRVIGTDRTDGFAMTNLGISLHRQGHPDEAMEFYEAVYRMGYRSADLMNGMGIYHVEKGDIQQAVSYWKRGLDLEPGHQQIESNLRRAARMMQSTGQERN
jgi:hypothetical protein